MTTWQEQLTEKVKVNKVAKFSINGDFFMVTDRENEIVVTSTSHEMQTFPSVEAVVEQLEARQHDASITVV